MQINYEASVLLHSEKPAALFRDSVCSSFSTSDTLEQSASFGVIRQVVSVGFVKKKVRGSGLESVDEGSVLTDQRSRGDCLVHHI